MTTTETDPDEEMAELVAAEDGISQAEPDELSPTVESTPEAQAAGYGAPPFPWDTRWLDAGEWRDLHTWVSWLRTAYLLERTIPPCWYRHVGMAQELAALWCAWIEVYEAEKATPVGACAWHTQWFEPAMQRFDSPLRHNQACTVTEHQRHVDQVADVDADKAAQQRDGKLLDDWLERRASQAQRARQAGYDGFTAL